jgi:hypothetical protein
MAKEIRKVFNYNSIILKDMTIKKEGYDPDILGKSSKKFIWAICRYCGEPHRIRKGFFNKAGSACHKKCKLKEQGQFSPMKDPEKREEIMNKIEKKYGTRNPSQNKHIAKKISESKSSEKSREKTKQTNLERYGVENVFQSEEIKEKIKETNLEKYGVESPIQNEEIKQKVKSTCKKRYGVDNVGKVETFRDKQVKSYYETISKNKNKKYDVYNVFRNYIIFQSTRNKMKY